MSDSKVSSKMRTLFLVKYVYPSVYLRGIHCETNSLLSFIFMSFHAIVWNLFPVIHIPIFHNLLNPELLRWGDSYPFCTLNIVYSLFYSLKHGSEGFYHSICMYTFKSAMLNMDTLNVIGQIFWDGKKEIQKM